MVVVGGTVVVAVGWSTVVGVGWVSAGGVGFSDGTENTRIATQAASPTATSGVIVRKSRRRRKRSIGTIGISRAGLPCITSSVSGDLIEIHSATSKVRARVRRPWAREFLTVLSATPRISATSATERSSR